MPNHVFLVEQTCSGKIHSIHRGRGESFWRQWHRNFFFKPAKSNTTSSRQPAEILERSFISSTTESRQNIEQVHDHFYICSWTIFTSALRARADNSVTYYHRHARKERNRCHLKLLIIAQLLFVWLRWLLLILANGHSTSREGQVLSQLVKYKGP